MSDTSGRGDGRDDRERAWVREILKASRAHLDLLYEAYFSRVYRMAHQHTANPAEAERVTEAVFLGVLRDLGSRTEEGPTVLRTIFGTVRHELSKVEDAAGKVVERAPDDELATPAGRGARRSATVVTPRAVATRKARIASP